MKATTKNGARAIAVYEAVKGIVALAAGFVWVADFD